MTNLESKMTDKTPQNKIETPATLARTTDAARDSEPKSRALPQADALKERFKAGSIPLQTDFADLIDLANMGRQAVGGAEGQTGPANGLTLSSTGRLELKPNLNKGIDIDKDGVSVKSGNGVEVNSSGTNIKLAKGDRNNGGGGQGKNGVTFGDAGGLSLTSNGLSVDAGNGMQINDKGLSIKLPSNSGLSADEDNGLKVITGNGIAVTSGGVNIKLAKGANTNGGEGHGTDGATSGSGGGLNLTSKGLSVDAGNGIQINQQGVSLKLATNSGLSADETNGLKIVPEQMFQKGMIMMFSGTKAETPKGWELCDGGSGTPDLRDRFIVMAGTKFTGKGDGTTSTESTTVTGTVNVAETKLTTSQIPSHSHNVELNSFYYISKATGSGVLGSSLKVHRDGKDSDGTKTTSKTETAGSGQGHKHTATMTTASHSHTISAIPPYYSLAFIMKL
jgi:microcystin-dependent protein